MLRQIIRRLFDHLENVRLEMGWRYDADQGLWLRQDWRIEERPHNFKLSHPKKPDVFYRDLHAAMRMAV